MNHYYVLFGALCVSALLVIELIICIGFLIRSFIKKASKKPIIISIIINAIFLFGIVFYSLSHSTYYKYNDWAILQNNVYTIEQKYGAFDLGEIKDNEKGKVAYFIYIDNGPIMPDHLNHYYYMEYDERGVIYHVYDGVQPGG